jgi:demethylmenaquinone methyltransferase/2-methoxy-6-polyprenyl-1,4-benzoquinol methylase
MFDRIAPRYDLLNSLLSFGLASVWRRRIAELLRDKKGLNVLDVATGTADLLASLFSAGVDISSAVGLDLSANMLAIADRKLRRRRLDSVVSLRLDDAMNLPFSQSAFDVATCAFGIRNVMDVATALKQMHRVLKPGGKIFILEFSIPKNRVIRTLYLLYFRNIVPLLGRLISGDSFAYRYLNMTSESFASGGEFCSLLQNAGFINAEAIPMTFGIVSLYYADKPNTLI